DTPHASTSQPRLSTPTGVSYMPKAGVSARASLAYDLDGGPVVSASSEKSLSALLDERRTFPPSEDFRRRAGANDPGIYDRALQDPEAFWSSEAKERDWFTPWQTVLEWNVAWAKWFVGVKLNITYNCVDRHARSARRNK